MKAIILAAGYATRLYPLTKEYPKPLLMVRQKPIIGYILDKMAQIKEIEEIVVVTNSKFFPKFKDWQRHLEIKKPISVLDDLTKDNAHRLGAVGDMGFAIGEKNIKDDLLVVGGDNLFDGDLRDFLAFAGMHKANPAIGAYNIRIKSKAVRYGVLKIDRKNKVVDFQEKPEKPKSTLVAMCLYYFPAKRLGLIKEYLKENKRFDATGSYIDWLREKVAVYGYIFSGSWYDIGDHKFYNEAKGKFK